MVQVIAESAEQARDFARRLLDAAEHPAQVATVTEVPDGGVVGFEVSEELAAAAGFGLYDDPDGEPAASAPEAPARNASRATWATFLDSLDPPVTYPTDAGRDDLVELWDARGAH